MSSAVSAECSPRLNNNAGLTENFYYDNLYRLDYSQLNSSTNLDMTYDAMGRITNRSDVASGASWTYDSTHKHRVTQAGSGSFTYAYDANGNATSRNGTSQVWWSFNYPRTLATSSETAEFYYGPDRQKWKQTYSAAGAATETTYYFDQLVEQVNAGSVTDWRHYIYAGGNLVAVYSRDGTNNTLRYTLSDHQGSVSAITTSAGATYAEESFTAYGKRRDASDWSGDLTGTEWNTLNAVSRTGYTSHGQIGTMNLNHMNGRVQDAVTGVFLSADPYVTEPSLTQNYHRYGYVYNNPLSYTDPSGFKIEPQCSESTRWEYVPGYGFGSEGGYYDAHGEWTLNDWTVRAGYYQTITERTCVNVEVADDPDPLATASSIAVGFTPAGTLADICTAVTGKDCITGEKVGTFWRIAGIIPFASELRKGGQAAKAGARMVQGGVASAEQALASAEKWLGKGYDEIAPGVFRSADGSRQFRMTNSDLLDPKQGPHVHFESIGSDGRTIIENAHVLLDP